MGFKLPSSITTVTPLSRILAMMLFVTLPFIGFYLGLKLQKPAFPESIDLNKNTQQNTVNNELLNDLKNTNSNMLVSHWITKYAVYPLQQENIPDYQPFGQDTGLLSITDNLVILNLQTGERKVIGIRGLIPQQMVQFLKDIPSEFGAHFRLHIVLLNWSPITENVFWGKLIIYPNADPPVANEVGFFKFDIPNGKIESFALPAHGLFGDVIENTNAEKVVYENLDNGLTLYLYDLKSKQNKLIVSYPKEIFDKYCQNNIGYLYKNTSFYGTCGRDRGLRTQWEDNGFSYFDFVTGKRVDLSLDR